MTIKRMFLIRLVLILMGLLVFAIWYKNNFSMDIAKTYTVNSEMEQNSLLIATQGSDYKNAVVDSLVQNYGSHPIYIKVIDVSNLSEEDEFVWDAILILHTWEMNKPQTDAEVFFNKTKNKNKVVVLATSGDGGMMMKGVDGITGASNMNKILTKVEEIKQRLDVLLIP